MPNLVEIDPVGLEKKVKMCKVYDNDDRQRTILDEKSSLELKKFNQNSIKYKAFIFKLDYPHSKKVDILVLV